MANKLLPRQTSLWSYTPSLIETTKRKVVVMSQIPSALGTEEKQREVGLFMQRLVKYTILSMAAFFEAVVVYAAILGHPKPVLLALFSALLVALICLTIRDEVKLRSEGKAEGDQLPVDPPSHDDRKTLV